MDTVAKRTETITAISTPMGRSGMGIVRLSGYDVRRIIQSCFNFKVEPKGDQIRSHRAYYGEIRDSGDEVVDEAVMTFMKEPATFTGEDMAEFTVHGSPVILTKVLEVFQKAGATLAKPGEFTKRAFLNKKIDLVQAEAIADLINSGSYLESRFARRRISGGLSDHLSRIKIDLLDVISNLEAEIDFPDDDLTFKDKDSIQAKINRIENALDKLLSGYEKNAVAREGLRITIAGDTNTGKSTLFNALLEKNRAITSSRPGTTRDYISEELEIAGNRVKLFDTAGISRAKIDDIEKEGVSRTLELVKDSDIVIFVMDATKEEINGCKWIDGVEPAEIIPVINKIDLLKDNDLSRKRDGDAIQVSALRGDNVEEIITRIRQRIEGRFCEYGNTMAISGMRQKNEIESAKENIRRAADAFGARSFSEIVIIDLKEAYKCVMRLLGEDENSVTEEILANIFSNFCIGK